MQIAPFIVTKSVKQYHFEYSPEPYAKASYGALPLAVPGWKNLAR